MILVDPSIWIDHLHRGEEELNRLLEAGLVAVHPMVAGELAMGTLRDRDMILELLAALPAPVEASHREVQRLVTSWPLYGRGLSLVDAHLLASALLTPGGRLWTRDRRLAGVAAERNVGHDAR